VCLFLAGGKRRAQRSHSADPLSYGPTPRRAASSRCAKLAAPHRAENHRRRSYALIRVSASISNATGGGGLKSSSTPPCRVFANVGTCCFLSDDEGAYAAGNVPLAPQLILAQRPAIEWQEQRARPAVHDGGRPRRRSRQRLNANNRISMAISLNGRTRFKSPLVTPLRGPARSGAIYLNQLHHGHHARDTDVRTAALNDLLRAPSEIFSTPVSRHHRRRERRLGVLSTVSVACRRSRRRSETDLGQQLR